MAVDTGRGRAAARERAFTLLYEATQRGLGGPEILSEEILEPDPFTVAIVTGVSGSLEPLDERIARLAQGWAVDRMPLVDLTLLRMGVWELINHDDVPTAVVLNETVELANTYSTDNSGRFVNGVLAAAAAEVRPD